MAGRPSRKILSIGECMVEFSRAGQLDANLWRQGFAGDTLNVAWAFKACLDPDTFEIGYFTALGDDDFSGDMRRFLESSGFQTSTILQLAGKACGLYTISVDDTGERSFSYWRSASAARHLADDEDHLKETLNDNELVYLSGITLAILPADRRTALIRTLGKPGKREFKLAFDSNMRRTLWENRTTMCEVSEQVAAISHFVLPTFDDEKAAFGDASPQVTLERYKALGCREVVVKNGREPTQYLANDVEGEVPVAKAVQPLDTTGAGDSFSGTYLAARLQGADVEDAIGKATACCRSCDHGEGRACPHG